MFFAKIMRKRRYVTMLDPLQEKYGNWMGGVLYIPAFLGETMWSAAILGALGSTLSIIIDLEIDLAVILSAIIAIGYTFFGGLYSVAYTDVIQLICIFIGLWLTIPFAMSNPNVKSITSTKDEWLGTFDVERTGEWMDYAMHLVCGGLPWQVYFQRVLSAKKTSYAQGLSFFASFGAMFMAVPAVIIGAIAKSTDWQNIDMPASMKTIDANNVTVIADTRIVLPVVLQYLTPTWVSIFGMGAISAAVMSSADSSILSASSMFAHNIYKLILRPKASERELIWVVRIGILGVGAVATTMALTIKSIYYLFVLCSDLVFVLLFPQLVSALYIPFSNVYGSISAYIVGLFFRLGGGEQLISLAPLIVYPMYQEDSLKQLFPYRTLAMVLSWITLIVVSYTTKQLFERQIISTKYDFLKAFGKNEDPLEKYELKGVEGIENNHVA
ncbi:high-affinity choline transporter 1-like isoform X2 [Rhopilema esculentum]